MSEARRSCDLLIEEWNAIGALCESLTDAQWASNTDCPGWTVKDIVSHLSGIEGWLLGRAAPEHAIEMPEHVKNPIGERNEIEVDYRRPWPPQRVLEEFRVITAERAEALGQMGDEDLEAPSWTPIGQATYGVFMATRVVDAWVHEQDIRRAVRAPGHLSGPIPQHVFDRMKLAMPKVVGKNAAAPDGSVVLIEVSGVDGGDLAVGVAEGRGKLLDAVPRQVDVRLAMDLEAWMCLVNGRWDPRHALSDGLVAMDGDRELGEQVVAGMNSMF